MPELWRNNPQTPEGKYPIVLRRDGTALSARYFVMVLKDPAVAVGLEAYAREAEKLNYDPEYVKDVIKLAQDAKRLAEEAKTGKDSPADPCAPPHRKEDPAILAWARSIGRPGA